MGVYTDVHVCIRRGAPLDVETRALIVAAATDEAWLGGSCELCVPEAVAPRGIGEWLRHRVLGQALVAEFGEEGLRGYGGVRPRRGVRSVARGDAGPWMAEAVRRLGEGATFAIGSECPRWEGRVGDGGFVYLATRSPVTVRLFNLHRPPAARRPDDDGFVGEFFDVATLSLKSGPDGRTLSRSTFVRRLKKELGLDVTCRSSSW